MKVLLEAADKTKWCSQYEFQKNLSYLTNSHKCLVTNIGQKLATLKPLQFKVADIECFVESCSNQLNDIDVSLTRCVDLQHVENIEKCNEKLEVSINILTADR